MSEMKPCPFCGDTYIQIYATNSHSKERFAIGCNTLDCVGLHCESKLFKTEEEAIKSWNRRAKDGQTD
jgi:Lar family restriction alleviation protein